MGILDKVQFWKKDDGFDSPARSDTFASSPSDSAYNAGVNSGLPSGSLGSQDPFSDPAQMDYTANSGTPDPFADPMNGSFTPDPSFPEPSHNFGQSSARGQPTFTQQQRSAASRVSSPSYAQSQQPEVQPEYDDGPSRDVELILAKLDAIKAELDSVHQRVRKLEERSDAARERSIKQPPKQFDW